MKPKISVIIPVYNVENYLKECVDSVLNQTFSDYEIILVDDGSTDSSGIMCDKYAINDDRVNVIHKKNGGLSNARNSGLKKAVGKYIYFLDSDDYITTDALEKLYNTAISEKADVVFFDGDVFFTDCKPFEVMEYERGRKYETDNGKNVLIQLLKNEEYRTAVPLNFYKNEFLRKHNLLFKEGILHEDELFTFLVFNADGLVAHFHEKLYCRRFRPASIMTASKQLKRYESMLSIYFELSEMYKAGQAFGEAADMYLIRTAKSVLGKYNLLSEEDKKFVDDKHKKFKNDVMSNKGFGDTKLKIKCSGKIGNYFYRAKNKFLGE